MSETWVDVEKRKIAQVKTVDELVDISVELIRRGVGGSGEYGAYFAAVQAELLAVALKRAFALAQQKPAT